MCVENYWVTFVSDFMAAEVLGSCLSHEEVYATFDSCAYAAGNRSNIPNEDSFWDLVEDSGVKLCEQCGWWVESWELNEDNYCQDCCEESY